MTMGKHISLQVVGDGYIVDKGTRYYSERYNRYLTIPKGFYTDGATKAIDLPDTDAWIIHDYICRFGKWDDGTLIDNLTASTVLADELQKDGYRIRSFYWWLATYLFGGGAARKNGMVQTSKKD